MFFYKKKELLNEWITKMKRKCLRGNKDDKEMTYIINKNNLITKTRINIF